MKPPGILALGLTTMAFLPSNAIAAPILSIVPLTQNVMVGSAFDVAFSISPGLDLGAAPSLGAYDVTLAFDPSIVSFLDATYGTRSWATSLICPDLARYNLRPRAPVR